MSPSHDCHHKWHYTHNNCLYTLFATGHHRLWECAQNAIKVISLIIMKFSVFYHFYRQRTLHLESLLPDNITWSDLKSIFLLVYCQVYFSCIPAKMVHPSCPHLLITTSMPHTLPWRRSFYYKSTEVLYMHICFFRTPEEKWTSGWREPSS